MAAPAYVHPPSIKCSLPNALTPFKDIPTEWLTEIEPHVIRPEGWDACWYWSHRRAPEKVKTGEMPPPSKNPYVRVWEFGPDLKWRTKTWQARTYIARIFWLYRDETERWVRGHVRYRKDGTPYYPSTDKIRSQWEVKMTCKNPYCVNPNHFEFRNVRDRNRGPDLSKRKPRGQPASFDYDQEKE